MNASAGNIRSLIDIIRYSMSNGQSGLSNVNKMYTNIYTGLSLRGGGQGFSPAIMNKTPGYFHSNIEPKELPKKIMHEKACPQTPNPFNVTNNSPGQDYSQPDNHEGGCSP